MKKNKGFTLIEVLFCAAILTGLFVGVMSVYICCFNLQENSRNTNIVLNQARAKLEEIKNTQFVNIKATYNGKVFSLDAINGKIRTEVDNVLDTDGSVMDLLDIRLVACWRQKDGSIMGEGKIDGFGNLVFSDLNGNGKIESPIELVTAISKKN